MATADVRAGRVDLEHRVLMELREGSVKGAGKKPNTRVYLPSCEHLGAQLGCSGGWIPRGCRKVVSSLCIAGAWQAGLLGLRVPINVKVVICTSENIICQAQRIHELSQIT